MFVLLPDFFFFFLSTFPGTSGALKTRLLFLAGVWNPLSWKLLTSFQLFRQPLDVVYHESRNSIPTGERSQEVRDVQEKLLLPQQFSKRISTEIDTI